MGHNLSDDTLDKIKREVDQMFVNLHRALRGDDSPCPDCDWMERVRVGAWNIRGLIEHDPSNDPTGYIGSNARWEMHVKPVLSALERAERALYGADDRHAAADPDGVPDGRNMVITASDGLDDVSDDAVVMSYQAFDDMCRELDGAKEALDDALHEGDDVDDYCDTGAEPDF